MTYSVGGTVVINANGHLVWAQVVGAPTIYYGAATTLANTTSGFWLTKIETTGTNIRAVAYRDATG
jgi:hypothetical protein